MRKLLLLSACLAPMVAGADAFADTIEIVPPTYSGAAFTYSAPVITVAGASVAMVFSAIGQTITESLMSYTFSTTGGVFTKNGTVELALDDSPQAVQTQALGLTASENSTAHYANLSPGYGTGSYVFGATTIGVRYFVVPAGNWNQKELTAQYTLVSSGDIGGGGGDQTPVNEPAGIALLGFSLLALGCVRHVHKPQA